jgi:RNA polymerase sigma factor (sigma-70 family)
MVEATSPTAESDLLALGDEELIARFRADGLAAAREELVLRYLSFTQRFVVKHARRVGLAAMHIPDAQQQAALALLEAIDHYDAQAFPYEQRCSFHGFLNVVLRARFSDFVKIVWRAERRRDHSAGSQDTRRPGGSVSPDPAEWQDHRQSDPAELVLEREERARLEQAVRDLTSSKRFLWDRLSAGEKLPVLARQLGISYPAARRRLKRAMRSIATALEPSEMK